MAKHTKSDGFCSFCGCPETPNEPLLYGLSGAICEQCARAAVNLIDSERANLPYSTSKQAPGCISTV